MAEDHRQSGVPLEERRKLRHESRTGATYQAFLNDLCSMGNFDRDFAEQASVAVLCAFGRRVYGTEAKDMTAQLPLKLQELLQSCLTHQGAPERRFGKDELLRMVADDLERSPDEVEPVVRAVVQAVHNQISEGEVHQFGHMLPEDLAELWFRPNVH